MRNLLIDLLAGVLVTVSAIYDFGVPECYVFISFSILVIIGELYALIKAKKDHEVSVFTYRSKTADWYDLFLGVILITSYAEWLGFRSVWFYVTTILCLVVSINAFYNLLQRQKGKGNNSSHVADSETKMNFMKTLTDFI